MVNEHVKDQQYTQTDTHQQNHSSDDEFIYGSDDTMSIQDWESFYSEDLYNMWSSMKTYTLSTGASAYMNEYASYQDFVEFCYSMSSKKMYMYPVGK